MSDILYQHSVAQSFVKTCWRQASNLCCKFLRSAIFFLIETGWLIYYEEDKANRMPLRVFSSCVYICDFTHWRRFEEDLFPSSFKPLVLVLWHNHWLLKGAWPYPLQRLQSHLWISPCSSATFSVISHHNDCCCSHTRESLFFSFFIAETFFILSPGHTGGRTESFWLVQRCWHLYLFFCDKKKRVAEYNRAFRAKMSFVSASSKPLCSLQR